MKRLLGYSAPAKRDIQAIPLRRVLSAAYCTIARPRAATCHRKDEATGQTVECPCLRPHASKTSRNVDFFPISPSILAVSNKKSTGRRITLFAYTPRLTKRIYISRSFAFTAHSRAPRALRKSPSSQNQDPGERRRNGRGAFRLRGGV